MTGLTQTVHPRPPGTRELAIEVAALVKRFGSTNAVDDIDLHVTTGSVYGLLGPNGAGKTTIIRILATLLRPDSGTARVFGHDVVREAAAVRERISLTGQYASIDDGLTGRENMTLLGRLHGYPRAAAGKRADELLAAFDLSETAGAQLKTYSGGMRRRLDIAAGLIVRPDLLFLDEPTTGLDPRSRNEVWNMVRRLVGQGTTVLLTTQYLDEADQLADRIAIIDRGTVIAEGTSGQLKASVGSGRLRVRLSNPDDRATAEQVLAHRGYLAVVADADSAGLSAQLPGTSGAADIIARTLTELAEVGIDITEFALSQPSLDEVFLALTGHTATPTTMPQEAAT